MPSRGSQDPSLITSSATLSFIDPPPLSPPHVGGGGAQTPQPQEPPSPLQGEGERRRATSGAPIPSPKVRRGSAKPQPQGRAWLSVSAMAWQPAGVQWPSSDRYISSPVRARANTRRPAGL